MELDIEHELFMNPFINLLQEVYSCIILKVQSAHPEATPQKIVLTG